MMHLPNATAVHWASCGIPSTLNSYRKSNRRFITVLFSSVLQSGGCPYQCAPGESLHLRGCWAYLFSAASQNQESPRFIWGAKWAPIQAPCTALTSACSSTSNLDGA